MASTVVMGYGKLNSEVHARQPNLLYSLLVLQRYGATLVQIEVVLNLLLVFYEAMKISGSDWPVGSAAQRPCRGSRTIELSVTHDNR